MGPANRTPPQMSNDRSPSPSYCRSAALWPIRSDGSASNGIAGPSGEEAI